MANTYTQLHIQLVFAVKFRLALIDDEWRSNLHALITTVLQKPGHKMLQINSRPDHIHIFYGMRPHEAISDLVQRVKVVSANWVNENSFCPQKFHWQEGYGAFSYSKSHVSNVIRYIQNQEVHHRKKTFLQEYTEILNKLKVPFEERHIFQSPI
jgi:REP element-mobilizing transposase RayT